MNNKTVDQSRSNTNKPFYVGVGTSTAAVRCQSNDDVIVSMGKCSTHTALAMCDRMNAEVDKFVAAKDAESKKLKSTEGKPMPCPFCGGECETDEMLKCFAVCCTKCAYITNHHRNESEAIAAHNRVCKAVAANSTTISVGDTIAYRSCDDDQPEWKSFTVRLIEHGYLYENEDCSGDNIAIECAHKVVVRY